MNLYLDTEFNGFGGQLIAMALVSEAGDEWYETLPLPSEIDPWVETNVIPHLNRKPVDRATFNRSLFVFLAPVQNPHVFAHWYTDLVHFFDSFGGPNHMTSFNIACQATLLKTVPKLEPDVPHNALSDARALREWHMALNSDTSGF